MDALVVQGDGKVLVGGDFNWLGGETRNGIGRLNADGTLDNAFTWGVGGSYPNVYSLAVQSDGKILVGGPFTTLGGQAHSRMARLNPDGTLDTAFNAGVGPDTWSSRVNSLVVQADGRILVGGQFTTLGGQTRNRIGRLNVNGTVDAGFNPGVGGSDPYSDPFVYSLAVQPDGKIVVGGHFTTLGGLARTNIGRLNANGTIDSGFNPGASSDVYAIAVQADGKILVGGYFYSLGGQTRNYIGRLNGTGAATQSLDYAASAITWLRGGTSPEVWRTTFDYSTNGSDWISLGSGARISGGWQLTSVSLPPDGTLRARGHVAGGRYTASGWFVETSFGAPALASQPTSRTNDAGTTTTFSVTATGSEPLSYQWFKDGAALMDGAGISGAATPTLTVSDVLGADAGVYRVTASNAQGSVTSQVATLTVKDPVITDHPVSQDREQGQSVTLSVTAMGTAPLDYRWLKEGVAVLGAIGPSLTLTNLQGADAGLYCVVVCNVFGCLTSTVVLLTVNQATVDAGFNPALWVEVYSLALQSDGRILVANSGGTAGNFLLRLNADGNVDSGFIPGATNGAVGTVALQADGKILVGGDFTMLAGQTRNCIGRLNDDGTLDSAFNPGAGGGWHTVESLMVQADGKILVGGDFNTLGGQTRNNIGRLNADGTLDSTFNPGANDTVDALAMQADGKIVVSGSFTTLGGQTRSNIARLNANGTLDTTFNPGANNSVGCLVVQANGKILMGGGFTMLGGQTRNRIGRLNADGTVDGAFNPGADGYVGSLVLQVDGKILVGGSFTTLGGQTRNYVGRVNADGSVDSTFNPGVDGFNRWVDSLEVQADGRILVGGVFDTLGGQPRSCLGRLNNTGPAAQDLSYSGSTITWLRGGTSPEVWRTTFEVSTNGSDWMSLGSGTRISGGWQLDGVSVPQSGTVRARGCVAGGDNDSIVVTYSGVPLMLAQPVSRTNEVGSTATFSAVVGANPPVFYQWRFYGTNLVGQTNSSLVLSGVTVSHAGPYVVVVTNIAGAVTSAVATLTVLDPFIVTQPANQNARPGESVQMSVTAGGTSPLGYQWRKDGVNLSDAGRISGARTAWLTLSNVVETDSGAYSVVVSNVSSSVTSAVATLTVADPFAQLGEAVDAPQLPWSSGGAATWVSQTAVTHDGADAAQSGAIVNSRETWMETSVTGPGPLSFWWKVSSESGYDYLEFYTNSVRATGIAGEVNWQQMNYTLGPGTQVLRWRYMKDSSGSSGQDRGWVDQVSFTPTSGPPVITTQPTNQTVEASGTATFAVTASGSLPL